MKKSKQSSFFKTQTKSQTKFFGGALLEGKRKSLRPLSSKDSIHFVLRSRWATGKDSFLAPRNRRVIDHLITHFAKKFGVRIYERALNSNHIHLLLRITNRRLYRAFIKAVSGKIASHVMGEQSFTVFSESRLRSLSSNSNSNLRSNSNLSSNSGRVAKRGDGAAATQAAVETAHAKARAVQKSRGFWEFRPFSRIVNWGKDFKTCVKYLKQNVLEALGFVPYTTRKNYYTAWLKQRVPDLTGLNTE